MEGTSLNLSRNYSQQFTVSSFMFALLAAACLAGCSSQPELSVVKGSVTYNGQPLKFGTVMFQNVKGGQPAVGMIQADGTFTMATPKAGDGVKPGSYEVSVTCYENMDPAKAPVVDRGDMSPGKRLIPQKYMMAATSGLTAEVKPDGNEPLLFELTDK